MSIESKIASLENEVRELKRMNRQPVRRHDTASKQSEVLRRDPAKLKESDLRADQLHPFKNGDAGGIIFRIDGAQFQIDGTKL